MSRKMKNLLAEKAAKQTAIQAIIDNPEATQAEVATAQAELATLNAKIEAQAAIDAGVKFDENGIEITAQAAPASPAQAVDPQKESVRAFAEAARNRFRNTMTVGTVGDGGYTVPADILTEVNKYRDAAATLRNFVRVEKVTAPTGRRVFQVKANQTGFALVTEGSAIGAKATPTFAPINYAIKKYAGYMPATNELLADSDANIVQVIAEWMGGEANATDNANIVTVLTTPVASDLTDIDGIKDALITTLGAAYRKTATILTNDSGLSYLSTLYDGIGRPILQDDPARPGNLRLQAGAFYVPVETVPDAVLVNTDTKVPFIIGDLKEAVALFDKQELSIKASDSAVVGSGGSAINGFEDDITLFKGIVREDAVARDASAWVHGYITVA